jgi:GT2 family glycosyltransferase
MNSNNLLPAPSFVYEVPELLTGVTSWHGLIPFAFALVHWHQPQVFVELGTHKGDSYCAFCQAVDRLGLNTACYAVDTWQGEEHAGFYDASVLDELRGYHDSRYSRFSRLLQMTFDDALGYFGDGSIDLLHIDGLHTYDAVKHDFKTWLPKLSHRAIVLFHDINVRERNFGVWQFWAELKQNYPALEFNFSNGLGILAAGQDLSAPMRELFAMDTETLARVSQYFYVLGERVFLSGSVARLQKENHAQGEEIQRLTQVLEHASAEQTQYLQDRDRALAAHDIALAERDKALAAHDHALAERDKALAAHDHALAERDKALVAHGHALAERDKALAAHGHALAERDRALTATEHATHERNQAISERDALRAELDANRAELAWTKARVERILTSTSWRLTAPLRRTKYGINGFKARLRDGMRAIYHAAPLSTPAKLRAKTLIFDALAPFIGKTTVYQAWKAHRERLAALALSPGGSSPECPIPVAAEPITFPIGEPLEPYQAWRLYNQWNIRAEAHLLKCLAACQSLPVISVAMPVYNTPAEFLRLAIESVKKQIYPHWELCIVDNDSSLPHVRPILEEYAASDHRIKIKLSESNLGISAGTNAAVALATGDFVTFLDHDDEIPENALAEVAAHLSNHPETDLLYSDSDKITEHGLHYDPHYKPGWSPELLLCYMCAGQLLVVRKTLYDRLGGMREGFDGSQDHDFALRAGEAARRVGHIPKVLYHWRAVPGSTALSGGAKAYSFEAGRRAVQEALARRNVNATAYQPPWALANGNSLFFLRFPDTGPSVTIIIPTHDNLGLLKKCLDSLRKTTYLNYRVLIVGDESARSRTEAALLETGHEILWLPYPDERGFNFAYKMNETVTRISSEYVVLLNDDTEVINPEWLTSMVGYAQLPGVGIVGALLRFPDGRVQHAGVIQGTQSTFVDHAFKLTPQGAGGYCNYINLPRNCSAVSAACLLISTDLYHQLGGMDTVDFGVAYNDPDLCYRAQDAGYRIVYTPTAELYHHEGATRGFADRPSELAAFRQRYRNRIDPFFNVNFARDRLAFEVKPTVEDTYHPRNLRILCCSHNLNLEGAPKILFEVAAHLKRGNLAEPIVFSPNHGPLEEKYRALGIQVIVDGAMVPPQAYGPSYEAGLARFAQFLNGLKVDVVLANTLLFFSAIDSAYVAGLPSVWAIHESEGWRNYYSGSTPSVQRRAWQCFSYPYRVVFCANATRDIYSELEVNRNFTVINNGIVTDDLDAYLSKSFRLEVRAELGFAETDVVALTVGTVCARKNQMDFVHAAKRLLLAGNERLRVLIVGDRASEYSDALHATIRELSSELQARFHIVRETDSVWKYYAAADVYVCSSHMESYPMAILEAMAFALPIISTPVHGIPEQVREGVNACYYSPGDNERLSELLSLMLNDATRRTKFSNASPEVLRSLPSHQEMCTDYARILREAAISSPPWQIS